MLFLIGIVLIVLALTGVANTGVIGVVLTIVGVFTGGLSYNHMRNKAQYNRDRYWAYGTKPDWDRRESR